MAKLYFKYGAMKSGKSLDLIRTYDTYKRQGLRPLAIYPTTDTRTPEATVSSRMTSSIPAQPIQPDNLWRYIDKLENDLDVILVDEAQFFTRNDIELLVDFVDNGGVPVVAYGLKTDFRGELFEGTKALLELADKIEEVKTICSYCRRKATHNMRTTEEGKFAVHGALVSIGSDEYKPVCRKCFYKKKKEALDELD